MSEAPLYIFPEELVFEKKKPQKAVIFMKNLTKRLMQIQLQIKSRSVHLLGNTSRCAVDPGKVHYICCDYSPWSADCPNPQVEISISYNGVNNFELIKTIPIVYVEKWSLGRKMEAVLEKTGIFKCPICKEKYSEDVEEKVPRILNGCGHTICTSCFSSLTDRKTSLCSFDSIAFGISKDASGQIDTNSVMRNLSISNSLRKQRLEQEQFQPEKLKYAEPSDQPCAEHPGHKATVFCDSCSSDYCEKCFTDVHKPKSLSGHRQMPISDKPIQLPKCSKHPYNTAEFICKETACEIDWKDMCHTCLLVEHKGHQFEILIQKSTENDKKLREKLEELKLREAGIKKKLENKEEILESFDTSSQSFRKKKKEISDYFEKKQSEANSKLIDFAKKQTEELFEEKEELRDGLRRTVDVRRRIERLVNSKKNLHSVREISLEAEQVCKEPFVQETHVPLRQLSISWKNGTELIL